MIKPKVVIFNMTARSGKDTAVNHLLKQIKNAVHLSYKEKLIETTLRFFDVGMDEWNARYDEPFGTDGWMKDVPWEGRLEVAGKCYSQRGALIHISEDIIKPIIGMPAFGNAVASQITDPTKMYLISDGGFDEELVPVLKVADVLILQRDRLLTDWKDDSRGWLDHRLTTTRYCPDEIQEESEYLSWIEETIQTWLEDFNEDKVS